MAMLVYIQERSYINIYIYILCTILWYNGYSGYSDFNPSFNISVGSIFPVFHGARWASWSQCHWEGQNIRPSKSPLQLRERDVDLV